MSHRLSRIPFFFVVPLLIVAVAATAAPGDQPAGTEDASVQAGVAPEVPALPGQPEAAVQAAPGQPVVAPQRPAPSRPAPRPGSEEAALAEIVAGNQVEVAALLQRLQAAADPQEAMDLQQEIVRVKTEGRLAFLQAKIDFARERGDEVAAQEALRAKDSILNPPAPVALPDVDKRAPGVAK